MSTRREVLGTMSRSSEEDEEMKRAIALSLESYGPPSKSSLANAVNPSGILGLDRAAMERERLARQEKRRLSVLPPAVPAKKVGLSTDDDVIVVSSKPSTESKHTSNKHSTPPLRGAAFPNGKVLKTWAFGRAREDDIKLEEVLQQEDLKLAVLCSFIWKTEWLFQKIDMSSTRVVCAMQAKDEMKKTEMLENTKHMKNLRLCFPSMAGLIGCMHSKLMLLAHPEYLRVVVPSGNLIPHDWGETGAMENVVFLIDLPRLAETGDPQEMTRFGWELIGFCKALGLDDSIVQSLHKFDFSATRDLAFVHTVGGSHVNEEIRDNTGFLGLRKAVEDLHLATEQNILVDFVTSSLGNINKSFLSTIYHAAQGRPPNLPTATSKVITASDITALLKSKDPPARGGINAAKSQGTTTTPSLPTFSLQNFLIYFPTHATVAASTVGPSGAGTICLSSKYYHSDTFPRSSLRDCKSTRTGMVMHSKIMYVRHPREPEKDYAYVGSANLSESAWGKLVTDRKSKTEKLNCRNWECGVVVPVRRRQGSRTPGRSDGGGGKEIEGRRGGGEKGGGLTSVFKEVIPVPMQWPGEEYGKREPWFAFD